MTTHLLWYQFCILEIKRLTWWTKPAWETEMYELYAMLVIFAHDVCRNVWLRLVERGIQNISAVPCVIVNWWKMMIFTRNTDLFFAGLQTFLQVTNFLIDIDVFTYFCYVPVVELPLRFNIKANWWHGMHAKSWDFWGALQQFQPGMPSGDTIDVTIILEMLLVLRTFCVIL